MRTLVIAAAIVLAIGSTVAAQDRPRAAVEAVGGWAGFVDEATINHGIFGGAARWYLSPRVSVGPELVYMIGPGSDRDLFLTGNVTFDLFRDRPVTPFFVAGGGFMRHSEDFGFRKFSSTEGAFTGGGGVRLALGERVYLAPEARLGWELHSRFSVTAGWRF
jgi:hypothetical protein